MKTIGELCLVAHEQTANGSKALLVTVNNTLGLSLVDRITLLKILLRYMIEGGEIEVDKVRTLLAKIEAGEET